MMACFLSTGRNLCSRFYDGKARGSKWDTIKWKLHLPQPPRKRWSPEKTWSGAPNEEPSSTKYMWPTVCPGDRWEVNFKLPNIKVSASVIPLKKKYTKTTLHNFSKRWQKDEYLNQICAWFVLKVDPT